MNRLNLKKKNKTMNTTKTELLEEFDEEFGYLVLSKSGLPYCDVKYIRDRDKRIKQHFSKALDRYRDSVVEEEREKIEKLDAYYVLNGSIEKHKGGHLLDKDDVLKILND